MLEKYLTRHASPQGFDFTAVNLKIKKMQKSSAQSDIEQVQSEKKTFTLR